MLFLFSLSWVLLAAFHNWETRKKKSLLYRVKKNDTAKKNLKKYYLKSKKKKRKRRENSKLRVSERERAKESKTGTDFED